MGSITQAQSSRAPGSCRSNGNAQAVTPSDSTPLSPYAQALFVGGAGAVALITINNQTVTFAGVPAEYGPCPRVRTRPQCLFRQTQARYPRTSSSGSPRKAASSASGSAGTLCALWRRRTSAPAASVSARSSVSAAPRNNRAISPWHFLTAGGGYGTIIRASIRSATSFGSPADRRSVRAKRGQKGPCRTGANP